MPLCDYVIFTSVFVRIGEIMSKNITKVMKEGAKLTKVKIWVDLEKIRIKWKKTNFFPWISHECDSLIIGVVIKYHNRIQANVLTMEMKPDTPLLH